MTSISIRRALAGTAAVLCVGVAVEAERAASSQNPATASPQSVAAQPAPPQQSLVNTYCLGCHSAAAKAGGLVLQGIDPQQPAAHPEVWEKVIKKVRSGEMPPAGRPRPDAAALTAFTEALVHDLDATASEKPFAGRSVLRRLNRQEYGNAVRDLLGIDLPFEENLPSDGVEATFDNNGDALSMSPVLLEGYVKSARKISQLAVGTMDLSPLTREFRTDRSQDAWLGPDMPFGTRGGVLAREDFPADAEYDLRVFLDSSGGLSPTPGIRFFHKRLPMKAGMHTVIATFPDDFALREGPTPNLAGPQGARPVGGPVDALGTAVRPTVELLLDGRRLDLFEIRGPTQGEAAMFQAGPPRMDRIEIVGPYDATGPGDPPSRQRLLVCRPKRVSEESACASKIFTTLARRAYRRDPTREDLQRLIQVYGQARAVGTFDEAITAGVGAVLMSPDFLFRVEADKPPVAAKSVQPVSDFELATRLSFFLWSTGPDDELLDVAHSGKLKTPAVLLQQVTRLLGDRRAESLVDNFAAQWLKLRTIDDAQPDPMLYPDFDQGLREAAEEETRLFLRSVLREDRSIVDLVAADYTFVNDRLAKLYNIPNVMGVGFRRVSLAEQEERGGLLGQASVLMMTSHPSKTSPVLRGNWILTNLLNSPPPPPPPGVPPLNEAPVDGKPLTTRQEIERHRANPTCSSCHSRMDPLGFALENFDVMGRFRDSDAGGPIDPSGKLSSGEPVSGPQDLRQVLVHHSDLLAEATLSRLLAYALGRELEPRDQPTVRRILRDAEPGKYKFSDLIKGIATSVPFLSRQTSEVS